MNGIVLMKDRDLALVRKTVAADLLPPEFDHFIHMARHYGLDPLRRQIYAIVYKKKKKDEDGNWHEDRRVTMVTAIDGYRAIADRTGNYRPGKRSVETSKDAVNPETNPHGIVSATVSVWKRTHGEWHEFSETVYWDEYAPLKEVWENKKPTGRFKLDTAGQWGKMGRVMLQKCAEAQALRRGWPDSLSDLYVQEEMDQAQIIDITPSEQAEQASIAERQAKLGGPTVLVDWMDDAALASVPVEKFHGAMMDFIRRNAEEPTKILLFRERNREPLRQFWGLKPDEAHNIKQAFEIYEAGLRGQEA